MDDDEIPFGTTRQTVTGTAPPLDVDETPARQPDYWTNSGHHVSEYGTTACHQVNSLPGHGSSPEHRWMCTREAGHPGPHIAQAGGESVVAVWEDAGP